MPTGGDLKNLATKLVIEYGMGGLDRQKRQRSGSPCQAMSF